MPVCSGLERPLAARIQTELENGGKALPYKMETHGDLSDWADPLVNRLTRWVLRAATAFVEAARGESLDQAVQATRPGAARIVTLRSWASVYRFGDHHNAHFHPNTAIAAIYYVASPGICELDLVDPRANVDYYDPGITFGHEGSSIRVTCLPGDLLLLPGWLKHTVPSFADEGVRISIAWNLGYQFGDGARLFPAGG